MFLLSESTLSHDNFDGAFETMYKYENGNVSHQDSDLDGDGKIDYQAYFEHRVLTRTLILGKYFASPKKQQTYRFNKLTSAEYDADGDGVFEKKYEYDYFEEIKEASSPRRAQQAQRIAPYGKRWNRY